MVRLFNKIKAMLQLQKYLMRLNSFDYKQLYHDLDFQNQDNQYLLKDNHFNRGRQYVKSFGLLGLSFEKLIDRKITSKELKRIVILSHLAPIYDDLIDRINTPKERITELMKFPLTNPKNDIELMFLMFYRPLFSEMKEKKEFVTLSLKLANAQDESKKQLENKITTEEILSITAKKGGYSSLLLFSLLDTEQQNQSQLYQFGSCCQYMDDIFDWYEDSIEQRKTIATTMPLKELTDFYFNKTTALLPSLPTDFKSLAEILLTPGNICLSLYQKQKTNTITTPKNRVLCDMERFTNIQKLIFNNYYSNY